jgi:hypothetical protein
MTHGRFHPWCQIDHRHPAADDATHSAVVSTWNRRLAEIKHLAEHAVPPSRPALDTITEFSPRWLE